MIRMALGFLLMMGAAGSLDLTTSPIWYNFPIITLGMMIFIWGLMDRNQ